MDPPVQCQKSFIIRCCLLAPLDESHVDWRFVLIDPQTGTRVGFPSLAALVCHLEMSLQQLLWSVQADQHPSAKENTYVPKTQ